MSGEYKGGRGKSRLKEDLQNTQQLVQEAITSDKAIEPAKQRLLSDQLTSLTRLYELEQEEKKERVSEQLKSLQAEVERLTQENTALRETPAVVVNSSTDSFVSAQLDKVKSQLDGALQRIKQLESEASATKSNYQREVAALTAEIEDLRTDANFGRQVKREGRIEELRGKIREYDARIQLPNCGIDPRMSKQAFEQLMASEKADRDELDELLGTKKHAQPKKVPVHPDVAEHCAEQAQLTAQWNQAYARNAVAAAPEPDTRSIPRHGAGVQLYGFEPVPEGWDS